MFNEENGNPLTLKDYYGNILTVNNYSSPPSGALIDPQTPDGAQPNGHTGYTLAFSDEFKSGHLNDSKWLPWYPDTDFWNTTTPGGHKTNSNEPQGYDPSGISFDEDGLVLTLREEETVPGLAYTSGMICSYPSFNTTYGYFEARMLLPNAEDAWPAFWMFPTNMSWPPEIDWMENWGKVSFNLQTEHTFHYPRPNPGGLSGDTYNYQEDVGNNWHTFGGLWEPGRIRWYVDGDLAKDLEIEEEYANTDMFMICNLAGDQGSQPATGFSAKVSHIRVWNLPQ